MQQKIEKKRFVFEINASELFGFNFSTNKEYLSSAVNVLKKILNNFHVSKSDFCNSITFTVIT